MIPDNRVNSFHIDQVWESPKGTLYKVVDTNRIQATLRLGIDGKGRIVRRPWDSVIGWVIYFDPEYHDASKLEY